MGGNTAFPPTLDFDKHGNGPFLVALRANINSEKKEWPEKIK
jgi:hypothetical protein